MQITRQLLCASPIIRCTIFSLNWAVSSPSTFAWDTVSLFLSRESGLGFGRLVLPQELSTGMRVCQQ